MLFRVEPRALRGRQLRLAVIFVVVSLLALPAAALAGKGQGKGGGGKAPTATLSVTPDPVAAGGAEYTVTGSGFTPGAIVYINEARPGCCSAFNVLADSAGSIWFTRKTGAEGTYSIKAMEKVKRRIVTVAEVSFEVVGS